MGSTNSLVDLGELSKPMTVLIQKISDAIGGLTKPWQTVRMAKAETEADKIRALAQIEVTEIQRRALIRFVAEETKKQANIEGIAVKAVPHLKDDARPQDMEDDWISNFFEKCRLISDEEMQIIWSKVLAGEANNPGTYSKRTVNFVSSIDKADATLFTSLCAYCWLHEDNFIPFIYDPEDTIYAKSGVTWATLKHLGDIGLISWNTAGMITLDALPEVIQISYHGVPINVRSRDRHDSALVIGRVLLTQVGQELAPISGAEPIPEFLDFVLQCWMEDDLVPFSDWPRKGTSL